MKRLVVFLPDDVHEALVKASEQRYESMSNIGRRVIIEWLIDHGYLTAADERPRS